LFRLALRRLLDRDIRINGRMRGNRVWCSGRGGREGDVVPMDREQRLHYSCAEDKGV